MAALSLRLPESLHRAAREVAQQDGVSLNQLVMTALGEKLAALKTADYLKSRARGANNADWDTILGSVPCVEPDLADQLPARAPEKRAKQAGRKRPV